MQALLGQCQLLGFSLTQDTVSPNRFDEYENIHGQYHPCEH